MTDLKKKVINDIIDSEGGYIDDPLDSGGETKYGITKQVARAYGFKGKMKNLTRDYAFMIYSKMYWEKINLDATEVLSPALAEKLADIGVNMGTGRAGRFLQRALNVLNDRQKYYGDIVVDGEIGPGTLKALRSYFKIRGIDGEEVLVKMINVMQGAFYISLAERREKDERFVYGWFKNRVLI